MKILILTQKVDSEDSNLGFFHRWIEEFAKHAEMVHVICLFEGAHSLPSNVTVHSLGKEKENSRWDYLRLFYTYIWQLRHEYDAVFVHMNQIYVILGGVFWRMWKKKIGLWYTHKEVTLPLRIATLLTNVIFTASNESFRIQSKKKKVMGHGIDTEFFSSAPGVSRNGVALSVGRLAKSKRHDLIIRATARVGVELHIIGDGPERQHLESLAEELKANVCFLGGLTQQALRDEYRSAAYLIHTSDTGSLDKVVLEALACDLPVITTSSVYKEFPVHIVSPTEEDIARALIIQHESSDKVQIVREKHSLKKLIPAILENLRSGEYTL